MGARRKPVKQKARMNYRRWYRTLLLLVPVVGAWLLVEHMPDELMPIENVQIEGAFVHLSRDEIQFLKTTEPGVSLPDLLTDVMRRKLLRRTRKQKGEISLKDLKNIEKRAASAYTELKDAHHFQYVIPNHDGEDSENWDAFYYPLGDARNALNAFVSLLDNETPADVEHWEDDLIPALVE